MAPTTEADVAGHLERMFEDRLGVRVPARDEDLIDSGLLDSLALVELLLSIEEEYGMQIPFDRLEIDDVRTVNRLAAFICGAR